MQERRTAPRIDHQIPVTVKARRESFVVQTKNLSASGAYCVSSSFLAPMTRLNIQFRLKAGDRSHEIACRGVVVRVNPPSPQRRYAAYDMAIFFSDLSDEDRAAVARYVLRHLQLVSPRE